MAAANPVDGSWSRFLGGGYYEHHIPAVIDQLISRSDVGVKKTTSNICSNQGICAVMVSIYLSLLGKNGLPLLARDNFSRTTCLQEQISVLSWYSLPFSAPVFNEFVVSCPQTFCNDSRMKRFRPVSA